MKCEAAHANNAHAEKGDRKDGIMAIFPAVENTLERQKDEEQVGHGIDDFRRIVCRIVILSHRQLCLRCRPHVDVSHLLAPVQGGSDRGPIAIGAFGWVRYRW